jgi:hypothetical protein
VCVCRPAGVSVAVCSKARLHRFRLWNNPIACLKHHRGCVRPRARNLTKSATVISRQMMLGHVEAVTTRDVRRSGPDTRPCPCPCLPHQSPHTGVYPSLCPSSGTQSSLAHCLVFPAVWFGLLSGLAHCLVWPTVAWPIVYFRPPSGLVHCLVWPTV